MYNVSFGVKLNTEQKGGVFTSPNKYKKYAEAKMEANIILNQHMKKLFEEWETDGFIDIPEEYEAWYEDSPNELIVSRLDATFDCGEFYILITKDRELN